MNDFSQTIIAAAQARRAQSIAFLGRLITAQRGGEFAGKLGIGGLDQEFQIALFQHDADIAGARQFRLAGFRVWHDLRMDNLQTELADQIYTLATINQRKYEALTRLYTGVAVMTAKLVGTNELLVIPPQGAARHIYVRSENGRAAYLYAGSRAYARQ